MSRRCVSALTSIAAAILTCSGVVAPANGKIRSPEPPIDTTMSAPAGPESGIQHVALLPGSRVLSEMPIQVITDSTILAIRFHSPITSDLMASFPARVLTWARVLTREPGSSVQVR